ncbi:30S ribosomal protein S16 [Rickettsiales bacterium LUAb2]
MAVKIRLARHGAKHKPYYHIVASNSRSPRDGKFLKTLGKYDPMQPSMEQKIINLDKEGIAHWLKVGAQPTDSVNKILAFAGIVDKNVVSEKTKKSLPKTKAQERLKEKEAAKVAAEQAKAKAEEAPVSAEEVTEA